MSTAATVLLAESNRDDVLIMQNAFRDAEIKNRLLIVENGEQALAYFKGEGKYRDRELFPLPSLFLISRLLHLKDGVQVLEWIANQPMLNHKMKVLMLSAAMDTSAKERAHALGAEAFVLKPFRYNELVLMVAGWKKYLQF